MTFTIEADSVEEAYQRVRDLHAKINSAARRLGIGYEPGTVVCQKMVQAGAVMAPVDCPDQDPETLFDIEEEPCSVS